MQNQKGHLYPGKRVFDLILASVLLFISLPLMGLLSLAVLIFSGRPILFRSKRRGLGGKSFFMFKFRSMKKESGAEPVKTGQDSRITPLGRVMRKFRLDELPQLFNILRGEMSLIGPRALPMRDVEDYKRLDISLTSYDAVLPGTTGAFQVKDNRALLNDNWEEYLRVMMTSNEEYIENASLLGDCLIVLKTVSAICGGKGM